MAAQLAAKNKNYNNNYNYSRDPMTMVPASQLKGVTALSSTESAFMQSEQQVVQMRVPEDVAVATQDMQLATAQQLRSFPQPSMSSKIGLKKNTAKTRSKGLL